MTEKGSYEPEASLKSTNMFADGWVLKGTVFNAKMVSKRYGAKREPKGSKGTYKDTLVEQGRINIEKGCQRGSGLQRAFRLQIFTITHKIPKINHQSNHSNISHGKQNETIPEGSQTS